MTTIKFKLPQTNIFNPQSVDHGLLSIPAAPGVYIFGYLILINNKEFFCPVNVGESNNLRKRLIIEHYFQNLGSEAKGNRRDEKELFNFKQKMTYKEVVDIYESMKLYNESKRSSIKSCNFHLGKTGTHCNCFIQKNHNPNSSPFDDKLVFFRNSKYLNHIFKAQDLPNKLKKPQLNHDEIQLFDLIRLTASSQNKEIKKYNKQLNNLTELHKNNFYCIYYETTKQNTTLSTTKTIEKIVKTAISEELGIATTAAGATLFDSNYQIDLSCIKKKLIALPQGKRKKHVNKNNEYNKSKLIIPSSKSHSQLRK
jgi:hypothetical protein